MAAAWRRSPVPALVVPAMAQNQMNLPAPIRRTNPHSVNLIAFAKDVGDATGGKLQITVHAPHRCSRRRKSARGRNGQAQRVRF